MEQLIKSLPAVVRAAGDSPEVAETACRVAWNGIAGNSLREHSAARSLNAGILTIAVDDEVWRTELATMIDQLVYRLNSVVGRPFVRGINLIVDPDVVISAKKTAQPKRGTLKPLSIELAAAASRIRDPKLRQAFAGAAQTCLDRLETE
jgi:predicted nucleic acid-binding Zn ribbon protein